MKKNNIHLFNTPHKRQKTKTSELVLSLKSDRNLFSILYVASQFRDGNLDEFFSHENQPCPPSLSDIGVRDGGQGGGSCPPPQFGQFDDMNSGRESTLFGQKPINVLKTRIEGLLL